MMRKACLLLIGATMLVVPPSAAEWLVTRDGIRLEIEGEMEVQQRKVVFRLPNGTLSMMRLDDVDLDASAAANTEAKKTPVDSPTDRPVAEPIMVLTDADIPRAATEVDVDSEPALPTVADREPVQVIDWRTEELEDGGLEVHGTVTNTGRHMASNITVRASVKERSGIEVSQGLAFLGTGTLLTGRSTGFRIIFPDLDTLPGTLEFEVTSDGITMGVGRGRLANVKSGDEQPSKPEGDGADSGGNRGN